MMYPLHFKMPQIGDLERDEDFSIFDVCGVANPFSGASRTPSGANLFPTATVYHRHFLLFFIACTAITGNNSSDASIL